MRESVIAGFFRAGFDGNLAVAALPPVIAAALAAACVVVMAGSAAVALSGRRARRRRTGRAVMVDFTGQRLTPYCWDAEGDFYEPTLSERGGTLASLPDSAPSEQRGSKAAPPRSLSVEDMWAAIEAVNEPGGLQRVVDGLNEAS